MPGMDVGVNQVLVSGPGPGYAELKNDHLKPVPA